MAHKIKNASPIVPHTYDETEDTYSPVSSLAPLPISVVNTTKYAVRYDEASTTVAYVGYAAPGTSNSSSSWQIFRLTESSGDITIEYADGDDNFDNVWNNRASLSYS